uniref:ShKT domain-containing protein n=3 Tax=Wuchereria bancrofti TaxID=6293 RepID=A0AAF5Q6C1_WUCBA
MAKLFPIIPRTGQVINHRSSSFPSISSQPKENLKKIAKIGERHDQLARIAGNTQQSSPMFIKLISKNLSKGHSVDQQIYPSRTNWENSGEWQLNKPSWWYSNISELQLKHNTDEKMTDTKNEIPKLKKAEITEASCISNSKKQKYNIFKDYLHFWNLSLEPVNLTQQYSLDISHISTINRKCSTDQKSTFCCEEITKNAEDFTNKDTNVCSTLQESEKCHEFCLNTDQENGRFINSTEYPCQEGNTSSISTFVDWIQTIIYNKTSAIIFGQNDNAKNLEFQFWTQKMLQNLDFALALNKYNSTTIFSEERISNIILLSQWIEFSKFNETTSGQEVVWQLLKQYQQQYDENLSSYLIRICMTNQDIAQIECTEQYYYNVCRLDDPDECMDDIFSSQKSIICRHFMIDDEKVVKITDLFCDSLNETIILWDYQRKASESATGIIILQLTRTAVIHSIPVAAAIQLDQSDKSESVKEKQEKSLNDIRLQIIQNKQTKNTYEKMTETPFSELSKITEILKETDHTFTTINSIPMQNTDQTGKTNLTVSESDITTSETDRIIMNSNITNSTEIERNFDDVLNGTTTNITNSNYMDKINATVEIQLRTVNGEPFQMDCSIEKDEFSITNCSNWADAGYCLSNNATRFLWCRKTCLCTGPQH